MTVKAETKTNGKTTAPILTAEQIFEIKDLIEETMEIPEWNGSIVVKSFSKKQQQEIREMSEVDGEIDAERLEMFMFIRGVVDPQFTDDQYELLREKNAGVMDRILTRLMQMSGMAPEQQQAAERKFPVKS